VGTKAAPKNSNPQSKGMIYSMLLKNPIGTEKIKAQVPKAMQSLIAVRTFFPL